MRLTQFSSTKSALRRVEIRESFNIMALRSSRLDDFDVRVHAALRNEAVSIGDPQRDVADTDDDVGDRDLGLSRGQNLWRKKGADREYDDSNRCSH
jgi:hypothetical protein